jgi:tetratricopeptide (TPR) repeat protein
LRGLFELQSNNVGSNAKAIEQFQRALAIDANDALAYEGLALAYTASPDEAPKIVMPKAKAAALKAIELDDSLAEAHSSLGFIKLDFDWDWPGAEQELRRSLELNPNSPLAYAHYANYLLLVPHRVNEAIQNCRRAYELNPRVPAQFLDLVTFLFFSRAYQAAIDEAAKELEDNSPFLALAYAELGRRDEALAVAGRAEAAAQVPAMVAQTATAYAMAGDKQKAQMLLGQLLAQGKQHYLCGMNMAAVYSVLGDKDSAMTWLEKGYRDRSV